MSNLNLVGKFFTQIFFLKLSDNIILFGIEQFFSFKKYWPQKETLNSLDSLLLIEFQFSFRNFSFERNEGHSILESFSRSFSILMKTMHEREADRIEI